MEDGAGPGSAMVVHAGTTPGDPPMAGYGLVALPPADERLVALWLFGKAPRTQRLYRATIGRFTAFTAKPLAALTLDDLQSFATSLGGLAATTRTVMLATVKSLLTFGNRIGVLPLNVGAALRIKAPPDDLNERILTEPEIHQLLSALKDPRDRTLLRLAYAAALRVSELVGLRWRNLRDREGGGGQITVLGKGSKIRYVLVRPSVWKDVRALARLDLPTRSAVPTFLSDGSLNPDAPLFRSRKGGHIGVPQAWRIVRRAAEQAGLTAKVSPHWLRHAHASHALDRGAPIHLVRDSLGHANVATTSRYAHARPNEHSEKFLAL